MGPFCGPVWEKTQCYTPCCWSAFREWREGHWSPADRYSPWKEGVRVRPCFSKHPEGKVWLCTGKVRCEISLASIAKQWDSPHPQVGGKKLSVQREPWCTVTFWLKVLVTIAAVIQSNTSVRNATLKQTEIPSKYSSVAIGMHRFIGSTSVSADVYVVDWHRPIVRSGSLWRCQDGRW